MLIRYADARYGSVLHKTYSRNGYILIIYNDTVISWRFNKKILVATSSNHSEIIALHEVDRECVWFMLDIEHIQNTYGLKSSVNIPTDFFRKMPHVLRKLKTVTVKVKELRTFQPSYFVLLNIKNFGQINVF